MEYKKEEVGGLKQSFMAGFLIAISNPLNLVFGLVYTEVHLAHYLRR